VPFFLFGFGAGKGAGKGDGKGDGKGESRDDCKAGLSNILSNSASKGPAPSLATADCREESTLLNTRTRFKVAFFPRTCGFFNC